MTLNGEHEETWKIVLRMLTELMSVPDDSREDTGHCDGLVRRRNGTEPKSPNLMENEIKMLRT